MAIDGAAGGLGGPGGLGPTKGPDAAKDLSKLGKADSGDVSKFKEGLGQDMGNMGVEQTQQQPGPFGTQETRITNSTDIQSQKPSLGENMMNKLGSVLDAGSKQDKFLMDKLQNMGEKGMTPADAMEFQYHANTLNITSEIASKGAMNVSRGLQTVIKGQ